MYGTLWVLYHTYHYCPVDDVISLLQFFHYFNMTGVLLSKQLEHKSDATIFRAEFPLDQSQHMVNAMVSGPVLSGVRQSFITWTIHCLTAPVQYPQVRMAPLLFQNEPHLTYK